jgi:hypothetical protein
MKYFNTYKEFLNEKYDGNLSDFKYDLELAIDNLGFNPKVIKAVSKKGNGFEVRLSSYMSQKGTWEKLASELGATLTDFKPGSINVGIFEKYVYPDNVKVTGDKILDKFAKLIHTPSGTVKIMSWAVQGLSVPFMNGTQTFSVTGNPSEDTYAIRTSNGLFRLKKDQIKKAEELYDEVESLVQAGKPKRSVEESLSESINIKDIKVGTILNFKDGEVWKVTKIAGPSSNPRGFFAKPHDEKTKKANTSVEIELKPDFLQKELESLNESSIDSAIKILKKENIMAYPNPEDLAKAIHKHYKEITGNKYEDAVEMSMNDKVADIVSYYKIDGSDFMSAWDKTIKD